MAPRSGQREGSRLLALPLVQPHSPARLHQRRLGCHVRRFQSVSQGSIRRVGKPVGSVPLQRREFPDRRREVACYVPGYVLRVLRSTRRRVARGRDGRLAVQRRRWRLPYSVYLRRPDRRGTGKPVEKQGHGFNSGRCIAG